MYPANTLEEWYQKNISYRPLVSFTSWGVTKQVPNITQEDAEKFFNQFVDKGELTVKYEDNEIRYYVIR